MRFTPNETRAEERDRARRMLDGYRSKAAVHGRFIALMESIDSRMTATTAAYGEFTASGTAHDAIGDHLAALDDQRRRMEAIDDRVCAELDAAADVIAAVSDRDATAGAVLAHRYLCDGRQPDFAEIAERMGYSEAHVKAKHLDGLDIAACMIAR